MGGGGVYLTRAWRGGGGCGMGMETNVHNGGGYPNRAGGGQFTP